MILTSGYMNDPLGVELTDDFDHVITIIKPNEGDLNITFQPFVSVDFFNKSNGQRLNEYPENNRTFTWEGIELLSDLEILAQLIILVPELK
jgi:hypothetical protein